MQQSETLCSQKLFPELVQLRKDYHDLELLDDCPELMVGWVLELVGIFPGLLETLFGTFCYSCYC